VELMQADASPQELNGTQQVIGPRREALAHCGRQSDSFSVSDF
jgi:hypothetical protein